MILKLLIFIHISFLISFPSHSETEIKGYKSTDKLSPCSWSLEKLMYGGELNQIMHLGEALPNIVSSCKLFKQLDIKDISNIPPAITAGALSPLWAQEMIGLDLADELLNDETANSKNVNIVVLDEDFGELEGHGSNVSSLIQTPLHILSSKNTTLHQEVADTQSDFQEALVSIKKKGVNTDVISLSLSFQEIDMPELSSSRTDFKSINEMQNINSVVVISAGNRYPRPVQAIKSEFENGIIVGSVSPLGYSSHFSQYSKSVSISAPADDYILTMKKDKKPTLFRGTSASTPLVSGVIASLKSIIPSLNRDDIYQVLTKSALEIPSYYEEEKMDGAGMINAYKALSVVKKISEDCNEKLECIKESIRNPASYHFPFDSLRNSLLENFDIEKFIALNCVDQKKILKELRKGFFLSADKKKYAKVLSQIYASQGYSVDSTYYELMSETHNGSFPRLKSLLKSENRHVKEIAIKGLVKYGVRGEEALQEFKASLSKKDKYLLTFTEAALDFFKK